MEILVGFLLFQFSVYGLACAIAVLKIGQYIFGQGYCFKDDCRDPRHPKELRRLLGKIPYLGDLFYCPPCLAFWIGVAFSRYLFSPASRYVSGPWWQPALVDALAACGISWLLHARVMREIEGLKKM